MFEILLKFFFAAFLVLTFISVLLYINAVKKKIHYLRCYGKIIGFHENTAEVRLNSYENMAISPVIEYKVSGDTYSFIGSFCSTSMKIGDEVNVLYNVNDYSKAIMEKGIFFGPIITSSLSLFFLIIVIILYFLTINGIF